MTDLAERLRHWLHIFNAKDLDDTLAAAADEIERLRAENERMRHVIKEYEVLQLPLMTEAAATERRRS